MKISVKDIQGCLLRKNYRRKDIKLFYFLLDLCDNLNNLVQNIYFGSVKTLKKSNI